MGLIVRYLFIFVYCFVIYVFQMLLRHLYLLDYIELCYGCTEMDSLDRPYDYIVVGSGSAGSIVARRLAEDPNVKVLLLEAGSHDSGLLRIPSLGIMLQQSVFDWHHQTVAQENACLALDQHASRWPMGKIFGGTNMMNNMIYVRGHPKDFASWYPDQQDFDYTSDILYYFKKLEIFVNNGASNSYTGSVKISNITFSSVLSDHILNAARSLCIDIHEGLDSFLGFARPKATMLKGQRYTTARRLLDEQQKNVVIRYDAIVDKILLRNNSDVYGVRYSHFDEQYDAKATRGVILSAGTIGTPKLLMLSGIGPKRHLKSVGISPKIDLPVGNNLQDHVSTGLDLVLINTTLNLTLEDMLSPFSFYDFFVKGTGPLATVGCESIAFISTNSSSDVPDLQLMVLPVGITSDDGAYLRILSNIGAELYKNYFDCIDYNETAITILPVVLHPRSRGTVRLKDKNPRSRPLIDPKYLNDDYDVDILIKGINFIKKLIRTRSMRKLGARLNPNLFPGCAKFDFDTRPYWECYVRHLTITSYHPVGTCKLGEVIDYQFRIKGSSNLYVVDGSVLPSLPSGNPNAAIMMMAEKAADVIKYYQYMQDNKCTILDILVPQKLVC